MSAGRGEERDTGREVDRDVERERGREGRWRPDAERGEERRERGGRPGGTERISRWEWLTAAIGLLLVLGAIGYLGVEAVTGDRSPPAITVRADSITAVPGGYLVHFRARNSGDRAGAAVVVEGRLAGAAGGEPETSEATLDYVPGRSERAGGLFFRHDPRSGRLELRALGYAEP